MIRKIFGLVLAIGIVFSSVICVNAAGAYSYEAEAQVLNDLGLYKGISSTEFVPDLGTALNRETGVVMLLRIFGLSDEAENFADADATLAKFSDAANISSWAKNAVAYAVQNGLVVGYPDGTLGPKAALNGKAYCTLILKQLGFTPDYNSAPAQLADKGGLTAFEATRFTGKDLINDDLVGISYGSLSATDKDDKKVIEKLIEDKVVDVNAAADAGLGTINPLKIKNAEAIGNKTIEVILIAPAGTMDLVLANIQLSNPGGSAPQIASVSTAGWSKDSCDLLVTLDSTLTPGTLYTVKSGEASATFAGRAFSADTNLQEVKSENFKEISIKFDRPVKLDGLSVRIYEKYGTKSELVAGAKAYYDKNTITVETGEQKNVLYEAIISGVADFDGSVSSSEFVRTFIGSAKDDTPLKLESAVCMEPDTVLLKFNVRLDKATAGAIPNFSIQEKYGQKAFLAIMSLRPATEEDLDETGTAFSRSEAGKYVILTTSGMKSATLYQATVNGLKTSCGIGLNPGDDYKTFVGIGKPSRPFSFAMEGAVSNNTVKLVYDNKVIKSDAENAANYSISEAYGTKAQQEVLKAELSSDGKTLVLTTAPMKSVLYKLTINDIKDIYGNKINTADNKNTAVFAGKAAHPEIKAITCISINSTTAISVQFDQNLGENATDVANYNISGGIGSPYSVTKAGDNMVYLSIPETTGNQTYLLTVNNLKNSDGIPMGPAGVSMSFTGYYEAPPAPPAQPPVPPAELHASDFQGNDLNLSEANMLQNGAIITLTLTNDTFVEDLDINDFQLNNAPSGLSITGIEQLSDTALQLYLDFDGTDFDTDITDFSVTAPAGSLSRGISATSQAVTITATIEAG